MEMILKKLPTYLFIETSSRFKADGNCLINSDFDAISQVIIHLNKILAYYIIIYHLIVGMAISIHVYVGDSYSFFLQVTRDLTILDL